MLRIPAQPILAAPLAEAVVPLHWTGEPKFDGFRVFVARRETGRVVVRSRHGAELGRAFPEIVAAAEQDLPRGILFDGELVVWEGHRLAFEQLVRRMNRAGPAAARLAAEHPAHYIAFDLLHRDRPLMSRPQGERRAALEDFFATTGPGPTWTLCPAAPVTDVDTLRTWLSWTEAGVEGLVFKSPRARYEPGVRGWRKYRARHTTEAIVGAVTGSLARPQTLLLGRLDDTGSLRYTGRTVPLTTAAARDVAELLRPAAARHPWTGLEFSAAWGTREKLNVTLVVPQLVAEVAADVALDAAGRWRHPLRIARIRADMRPADVPGFGSGNTPSTG